MRRIRIAQQALRLTVEPYQQQHICRICLAQAARQIHSSVPRNAKIPFLKSLRDSIFGSKEAPENKQDVLPKKRTVDRPTTQQIKGQTFQIAPSIKPNADNDYAPALRWDGLERIGSVDWVEKQAFKGASYVGYLGKTPMILSDSHWRGLLHRVAVEALLRKSGNKDLKVGNAQIVVHNGEAYLEGTAAESEQPVQADVPGAETTSQLPSHQSMESKKQKQRVEYLDDENADPSWMEMKLTDPKIKFDVVKRAMKLSNRRIPDYMVTQASTMADLYEALRAKKQPKRLYDAKEVKEIRMSSELPNVTVYSTRRTPVHKEKQVGRWKIIEKELQSRDLPIFGSRHGGVKERLAPM